MYWTSRKVAGIVIAIISVASMALYASGINTSQTFPSVPQSYVPEGSTVLLHVQFGGFTIFGFSEGNGWAMAMNSTEQDITVLLNSSLGAASGASYSVSFAGEYLGQTLENVMVTNLSLSRTGTGMTFSYLTLLAGITGSTINLTTSFIGGTTVFLVGNAIGVRQAITSAGENSWHSNVFQGSPYYISAYIVPPFLLQAKAIWVNVTAANTSLIVQCYTHGAALFLATEERMLGINASLISPLDVEYSAPYGLAFLISVLSGGRY
ncbi:MAG: hypothetical protein M1162_05685 [Candidatus Thermoplasmatota archaeon]|nr:hypothetical protein [Candidatus Thermoplasmatota archaeon]